MTTLRTATADGLPLTADGLRTKKTPDRGFASLFLPRTRGLLWLLLPILYFTFLTGTVGDARFRAPIEPLLCLFAAVALTRPPNVPRTERQGPPLI